MTSEEISDLIKDIKDTYQTIQQYHNKFLKDKGVGLPSLYKNREKTIFSRDALVLCYLAFGYPNTKQISKEDLTKFIKHFFPDVNDVQQARHLGAQKGWYIASGTRGDFEGLPANHYKLITLEKPYPKFKQERRTSSLTSMDWNQLKEYYDHRCAMCNSKEGQPHYNWPNVITQLQQGHMDPSKPLEIGNIIPQCQVCNRGDRDRWVLDDKGRVIAVNNPRIVFASSEEKQRAIYELLKEKFKD